MQAEMDRRLAEALEKQKKAYEEKERMERERKAKEEKQR